MSETHLNLSSHIPEWRAWDIENDMDENEDSEPTFELPDRGHALIIRGDFLERLRQTKRVSGPVMVAREMPALHHSLSPNEPSSTPAPEVRVHTTPQYPKWLRLAFVVTVCIEIVSIGLVLLTPFFEDRILTVVASAISALGLAALSLIGENARNFGKL